MPASARRGQRAPVPEARGTRLLSAMFWAGVGLTPAAALLLLLGHVGGPLRVGAALALFSVVLIGLSITLHRDAGADLVGRLLDEVDLVRENVRADVAVNVNATQRAVGERLQAVQQNIEAMRGEMVAIRAMASSAVSPVGSPVASPVESHVASATGRSAVARSAVPGQVASGVGRGVVRHTETVHVTTRHTVVGSPADSGGGSSSQGGSGLYNAGTAYRHRHHAELSPVAGWRGDESENAAHARHDQHSREYRIGERHTTVHANETGTQMRVEDRWASMYQEPFPVAAHEPKSPGPGRYASREQAIFEPKSPGPGRYASREQAIFSAWDNERDQSQSRGLPAPPASDEEPSVSWLRDLRGPDREPDRRPDRRPDREPDWHQPEPVSYTGHRQRDELDDERYGHWNGHDTHGSAHGSAYGSAHGSAYGSTYGSAYQHRH